MPTYVALARFTDQGFKVVKDTVKRTEAFRKAAKEQGAEVKEFVWTMGDYDMVTIIEAPDDETMSAVMLNALQSGNITAHKLRAFSSVEMERILRGPCTIPSAMESSGSSARSPRYRPAPARFLPRKIRSRRWSE
jgi:uncharacterized protein with GYD domain